jgi:putative salt-induced outer membrane protein YdiY
MSFAQSDIRRKIKAIEMVLGKVVVGFTLALTAFVAATIPALAETKTEPEVEVEAEATSEEIAEDNADAAAETPAQDEIVLKNGSRLLGTVVDSRDGEVIIDTDFAGRLTVAMEQIDSVHTLEPVVILMTDGTVLSSAPLIIEDQEILASGDAARPLEDLQVVNPEPWELGQGYKWSGLISMALELERGNTDTDELDYKLETVWRSKVDRYTLRWSGEQDEANGEKSADKWRASAKFDHFLSGPNYWGLLAFAEKDKFEDLDLRYLIGPYLGRTFYDQPIFTFSGELGVSYVNEEFNVAEDQDYPAANWALHTSSNYLGGDSKLYFDQFGVWNLDETADVIVNTTIGLSFPLVWNLEAAAEMLWEYDSGAVDDIDDMDETFKFRLGYTW